MSSSKKSDAVSIRFKYENIKPEVELVGVDEAQLHRLQIANNNRNLRNGTDVISNVSSPSSRISFSDGDDASRPQQHTTLLKLILSCTVAAGVQFGWALQLSLLTPYIQTLGIQHAFSSFIWLCGPITGLMVQPVVGEWSDNCTSKYGRRRPFILVGSLMISVAVILIGFSADIGYYLGDSKEHCSTFKGTRTRAAVIFILGFWMLDLANNTVQGPARALLADLAGPDQRNSANAIFCSWMAVGNILGFSAGASSSWNRWFPFLLSRACCEPCGNLKAAFLIAVVFLSLCTLVTLYFAKEVPLPLKQPRGLSDSAPLLDSRQENSFNLSKSSADEKIINKTSEDKSANVLVIDNNSRIADQKGEKDVIESYINNSNNEDREVETDVTESFFNKPGAVLVKLLTSLRHLPPAMHSVLLVMALTWLSWFPFFLFDTDWMGREVYHGDPKGVSSEVEAYDQGVREGAFGLLLNSVVLGISSLLIEPICRLIGARIVWATSNFIVFVCMAITAVISLVADRGYSEGMHIVGADRATKIASLIVFALLGIPLAITYSVPFSVTAEITADSGGGQGLAIGVLNLAIVVPQMIVSLGAGPWDALFGGGNIPAFVLASFCAFASGMIAIFKLPDLSNSSFRSTGIHFG